MAFSKSRKSSTIICGIILLVQCRASLALKEYTEACVQDTESEESCDSSQFLECYSETGETNGTCRCIGELVVDEMYWDPFDHICRSHPGQACDQGQTCSHHSECIQDKCECTDGYDQAKIALGDFCWGSVGTYCDFEGFLQRNYCNMKKDLWCKNDNDSGSNSCQCSNTSEWNGETCVRSSQNPGIGEICFKGDKCPERSFCDGIEQGLCKCDSGYSRTEDRQACQRKFDSTCDQGYLICNKDEFLICSPETFKCACEEDMVYVHVATGLVGVNKCRVRVGEVCDMDIPEESHYFFHSCVFGSNCVQESGSAAGKGICSCTSADLPYPSKDRATCVNTKSGINGSSPLFLANSLVWVIVLVVSLNSLK